MIILSPCNLCLCHCKQGNVFQAPSMTCMAAAFHRRVISGCRLMFFEQAREQEEAKWKANNQDSIVSPPLQEQCTLCILTLRPQSELSVCSCCRHSQDGEVPCSS